MFYISIHIHPSHYHLSLPLSSTVVVINIHPFHYHLSLPLLSTVVIINIHPFHYNLSLPQLPPVVMSARPPRRCHRCRCEELSAPSGSSSAGGPKHNIFTGYKDHNGRPPLAHPDTWSCTLKQDSLSITRTLESGCRCKELSGEEGASCLMKENNLGCYSERE